VTAYLEFSQRGDRSVHSPRRARRPAPKPLEVTGEYGKLVYETTGSFSRATPSRCRKFSRKARMVAVRRRGTSRLPALDHGGQHNEILAISPMRFSTACPSRAAAEGIHSVELANPCSIGVDGPDGRVTPRRPTLRPGRSSENRRLQVQKKLVAHRTVPAISRSPSATDAAAGADGHDLPSVYQFQSDHSQPSVSVRFRFNLNFNLNLNLNPFFPPCHQAISSRRLSSHHQNGPGGCTSTTR